MCGAQPSANGLLRLECLALILVIIEFGAACRNYPALMKFAAVCACLTTTVLAGCGYLPTFGPTTGQVID